MKYKSKHVKAILKVGQNNFPFEPYSEYLGFKIDRLLGMDKVPCPLAGVPRTAA